MAFILTVILFLLLARLAFDLVIYTLFIAPPLVSIAFVGFILFLTVL
jgi:hypothetical protein